MPHCTKQAGGRVVKPSEYYGGSSGRYFPSGSPSLTPCNSAYGTTNAVSFGKISDDYTSSGPNLGPYPGSSGKMTGGKRKKNRRKNRSKNNKNKKNKSQRRNNKNRNSRTKKRSLKNRKNNSSNNNDNKNKKNKKRTQKK